jgi:hypothetical protein
VIAFGCAAVFGIDEPQRDPCAGGACDEAGPPDVDAGPLIDGGAQDGAGPVTDGAAPDRAAPAGLRCGDQDASYCAVGSVCCQSAGDSGPLYACSPAATGCGAGYSIACARSKDCRSAETCCHFHSAIKCVPSSACSGEIVCDPSASDCPAGKSCDVPLIDNGAPSAYLGCAP